MPLHLSLSASVELLTHVCHYLSAWAVSLRVLENWSSVITIASATKSSSSAGSNRPMELERNRTE